jgi:signal transduction histidine kinase
VVPVDVHEVAAHAVMLARPTAPCTISLEVSDRAEAWARTVAPGRALSCVLDNAIRAAGPDGHVVVCVDADREQVHLVVRDDGPGLGNVSARTSLGLTTTRALVAACHGSFQLRPGPESGAVADISLGRVDLQSVAS